MNLTNCPKSIEVMCVDFDGVLANTELTLYEVNSLMFEQMGISYSVSDFCNHTFETGIGTSGWLRNRGYSKNVVSKFKSGRDAMLTDRQLTTMKYVDCSTLSTLKVLGSCNRLCIVTDRDRQSLIDIGVFEEIAGFVELVVTREDYIEAKPSPDAYRFALESLCVSASACLAIEDSPRGILAARIAGLEVIGIRNRDFPSLDLSGANAILASFSEVPGFLSRESSNLSEHA